MNDMQKFSKEIVQSSNRRQVVMLSSHLAVDIGFRLIHRSGETTEFGVTTERSKICGQCSSSLSCSMQCTDKILKRKWTSYLQ